jgi:hypothetical protein
VTVGRAEFEDRLRARRFDQHVEYRPGIGTDWDQELVNAPRYLFMGELRDQRHLAFGAAVIFGKNSLDPAIQVGNSKQSKPPL